MEAIITLLVSLVAIVTPLVSLLGVFVGWRLYERTERRKARQDVLANLGVVAYDYLAMLVRLGIARRTQANTIPDAEVQEVQVRLLQLHGAIREVDVRLWQAFREPDVRAQHKKLIRRFEAVEQYLLQHRQPSPTQVAEAIEWASSQVEYLYRCTAFASDIEFVQKEQIRFVGFRKIDEDDLRRFTTEDDAPPWQTSP